MAGRGDVNGGDRGDFRDRAAYQPDRHGGGVTAGCGGTGRVDMDEDRATVDQLELDLLWNEPFELGSEDGELEDPKETGERALVSLDFERRRSEFKMIDPLGHI